jgi:hypothetical protein
MINNFGKEDISYLDSNYFTNLIMNQPIETGYVQLIKDIYLNKEHPENQTVKVDNLNNKYAFIFNEGKWNTILKYELKEILHKKNYTILKMHYDKLKNTMSVPKREETFTFLKRDDTTDPHMMYVIDKIIILFHTKLEHVDIQSLNLKEEISEEYIEYTENYGKIEPEFNINNNTKIVMCDQMNNQEYNRDDFLKKLQELYKYGYIIHELDIRNDNNCVEKEKGSTICKIYIDNFCNYYAYGIDIPKSRRHIRGSNLNKQINIKECEYKYLNKLSNILIDHVKKINMYKNDFFHFYDPSNVFEYVFEILSNIQILSKDNHKKNNHYEKLLKSIKDKEIEELKAKLDEQTKLNEDICKRMFELKEELMQKQP